VLGGKLDSSAYGPPPLPWDIAVSVPKMFKDETIVVKVPHTESIKVRFRLYMLTVVD